MRTSVMLSVLLLLPACGGGMMMAVDSGMNVDPCAGAKKDPPNFVSNPDFECGTDTPTDWSVQYGTFTWETSNPKTGMHSAKVVANSSGNGQFGHTVEVVSATSGNTYCVNAWVRGTTSDMRLEVLSTPSNQGTSFGTPVGSPDTWLRVPPSTNLEVRVPANEKLYLRFRTQNGKAGDTLWVDDVDFWESKDGHCAERQ